MQSRRKIVKVFRHDRVLDPLEFILTLGIIYFFFSGVMTAVLGTDSYWMAVVSQSMKHDGDGWRSYFVNNGVNSSNFPVQGGFERGDLLVVQGVAKFSELNIGDVVVLDQGGDVIPLVHRIVAFWEESGLARFITKGDANSSPLLIERSNIPEQIIGKVVFAVPKIGYIGLWFQGQ